VGERLIHRPHVEFWCKAEFDDGYQQSAENRYDIGNDGKQRKGDETRDEAGDDQFPHGVHAHGLKRVDLLRDPHGAEFCGDSRTSPPAHHQSRQHGSQFPHGARADQTADIDRRTKALHFDGRLEREYHSGKQAGEEDDSKRADTDRVELDDGVTCVEGPCYEAFECASAKRGVSLYMPGEQTNSVSRVGGDRGQATENLHSSRFVPTVLTLFGFSTKLPISRTFRSPSACSGNALQRLQVGRFRLPAIQIYRKANVSSQFSYPDLESSRTVFQRAAGGHALVIGDSMLDRYVSGSVDRISPEAPVPVVRVESERLALGGAANVAAGIAALGLSCRLITTVGDDSASESLRTSLQDAGISADDLVVTPGRPTTQKTRVLARHQQMLRIDSESGAPLSSAAMEAMIERAEEALKSTSVLVFQDYDKGVISSKLTRRLLDRAVELGVPTVVDPKLRHFFDFQGALVIKPNIRELAAALGVEPTAIEATDLGPILERLGTRNLLLTLGEDGMLLVGAEVDGVLRVPSLAREVFDVTGAGDTVLAVIATCLVGEATLAESAVLATIAAGLEVSRLGAVPVTQEELLTEIAGRDRRPELQ